MRVCRRRRRPGGLIAAIDLSDTGAEVTVLEARDRVGGRMRCPDVPGVFADGVPPTSVSGTPVAALIENTDWVWPPRGWPEASTFWWREPGRRRRAGCPRWTRWRSATCSTDWEGPRRAGSDRRTVADPGRGTARPADRRTLACRRTSRTRTPAPFRSWRDDGRSAGHLRLHMAFYLRSGGGIPTTSTPSRAGPGNGSASTGTPALRGLAGRLGDRIRLGHRSMRSTRTPTGL